LMLWTIFGIMSFFAAGEAVECSSLAGVGHIGSTPPLASRVSSSSHPPIVSCLCSTQIHRYRHIVHW
jgi:hypothetical protein